MTDHYNRHSPSPRYRELLAQYRAMHTQGEVHQGVPAEQVFAGQSLPRHAGAIKELIEAHGARTLLDYGSGKGAQYRPLVVKLSDGREYPSIIDFWDVDSVTCYDPGFEPFSQLPTGAFDGVICTDVLEHCPEDDVPWILDEIFSFARKFVYANVACYPAQKRLANGENAHCTVREPQWWREIVSRVSAKYPAVRAAIHLEQILATPSGRQEMHRVTIHA